MYRLKQPLLLLSGFLFILNVLSSCSETNIRNIEVRTLSGEMVPVAHNADGKNLVVVFVSPDCPVCINYALTLNNLADSFNGKPVVFCAVVPGNDYSRGEVDTFIARYQLKVPVVFDTNLKLVRKAGATTTPEAIVIDISGRITYQGAVDNWIYETGRKRPVPTKHYLFDAIQATLLSKTPEPDKTEALGCMIEDL